MSVKNQEKEPKVVQEASEKLRIRTRIIYYAVMGVFMVLLGFLIFATLAK